MTVVTLADGRRLRTHRKSECTGRYCVVHNPSDHPLNKAPMLWRDDRGFMERVCPHGIGHPDPDDLAFKKSLLGDYYRAFGFEEHGCDGCCGRVLEE